MSSKRKSSHRAAEVERWLRLGQMKVYRQGQLGTTAAQTSHGCTSNEAARSPAAQHYTHSRLPSCPQHYRSPPSIPRIPMHNSAAPPPTAPTSESHPTTPVNPGDPLSAASTRSQEAAAGF